MSLATRPPQAIDPPAAGAGDRPAAGGGGPAGGCPLPADALGRGAAGLDPEPPAPKNNPAQAFLNTPAPAGSSTPAGSSAPAMSEPSVRTAVPDESVRPATAAGVDAAARS